MRFLRRALSTRMRRMASAAASKKCRRFCPCGWPRLHSPPAADTPHAPAPSPATSAQAFRGPVSRRPACAARPRAAARATLRLADRPAQSAPCCESHRSWVVSLLARDFVVTPFLRSLLSPLIFAWSHRAAGGNFPLSRFPAASARWSSEPFACHRDGWRLVGSLLGRRR
jgi:hypothetical protein